MLALLTLLPCLMGLVLSAPAYPTLSESEVTALLNGTVIKRGVTPTCSCDVSLVGNGSPAQRYKNEQVVDTVSDCGGSQCSTTKSEGKSWSWGVGANLDQGEDGFISGGFSVSESFESGQSQGCANSVSAQNVCMWYSQAYTSYDVQRICTGSCAAPAVPYTIYAPNNNNAGGLGYYCVLNTCQTLGSYYWTDGPAGGPP